jgi:hypothetical protein
MDRPVPSFRLTPRLALLSLALVLAGCGGNERDAARQRAEQYIKSEQGVMQRAQPGFERANQTYLAYSQGELAGDDAVGRVAAAERAIRNARDGVLVLDPPPEARRLHQALLRYLDMNVDLARETSQLARYIPAAARVLRPLDDANRRLEARLASAEDAGVQERVLERFAGTVGSIAGDLDRLRPPPVLESAHAEQLRRLTATRRLAGQLRRALRSQDAERVSVLLKRFRSAASEPGARRRLANQAVARYTFRLRRIGSAQGAVQREQTRLARSLG